ncbi:uncharacterized protein LOC106177480 [Lingula anatina]|uniref:Uncharacterized protein LOC106177480 n=1 Tax=Lingula anatina TaxID=7574 RepID=A0A1S3K0C3_LINAN|nr:uncharacterized protein LOC106177480 [Lingula anatina]|eukprot:XP_013415721.1 uncharacterized protein LOC106177480 [Lingula anatina]
MTPAFVFSQLFKNNLQLRSLTGVDLRINVYQGGKVFTASGATLSSKNQLASNGIVHVIDDVILPVPRDTVLQAARDHPDLTRLAEEFTSLNLTRALDGRSPITVFAPTDAAFEKIPKRIQDRLLKNIPTMTHILQQHIVPGVVYRAGLTNGDPVKTVTGGIHFITKTDKSLMIGGANIIRADISTRNGVLHLIDRILLPDDTEFETKAALPPGVPLPP